MNKKTFQVSVQYDGNGREILRTQTDAATKEEAEEWAVEYVANRIAAFAEELED